ncbi:MAG: Rieske (2Fe-2S) protein [Gemmatimonadaceae bacterium]|nr:Rieske (2Fe-2S) protein [Gemmatimonadaceae bacterium]
MSINESALPSAATPQPSCVTRRQFVIHGALATVAIALAGCVGSGGPTSPGNVNMTLTVSDYPALASVGGVAYVTSNGNPLAVVRTGTDTFDCVSRVCPHQGGTVASNGSGFTCPVHGARFADDGSWVGGQPTSNLTAYATSYDSGTGILTIG